MTDVLVWAIFGAAIGIAAHISATRQRHRAFGIDVAAGAAAALVAGESFATLGSGIVHGVSVFGMDPVAFYAMLAAAGGALAFFIALEAVTEASMGSARRHALIDLAIEFTNVAHRSRSVFRSVGLSVRARHPAPALAKSRTR